MTEVARYRDVKWNDRYDKGDVFIEENYAGHRQLALPHQCDSWIIGDGDAARALIADLQEAIEVFETND